MSTTHRVLDGNKINLEYELNDYREIYLYKATKIDNPYSIWVRKSNNHIWLYCLFSEMCKEHKYRYDRTHLCETKLMNNLISLPHSIPVGRLTQPPQTMPEKFLSKNSVASYRNCYMFDVASLSSWKKRDRPHWFTV